MQTISVGLLGFGTVGSGVVQILRDNAAYIEARLGAHVVVKRIAVQDLKKTRDVEVDAELLTDQASDVLEDPEIQIVAELVGGSEIAYDYVVRAIECGKHVVTANKTLLAHRGAEIFAKASAHKVDVFYEAAVGGGIPIIRTLRESLASERINSITGIVNGTTNFILSRMAEGHAFEPALADAQRLGYAEADPTADVDGHDAAQKLAILSSLAFGLRATEADVSTQGIRSLCPEDFEAARHYGYAIKFLAIAELVDGALAARVHPAWVPAESPLAAVNGVFNAVFLRSDALGDSMLYGQGAGQLPTGSAVTADIIEIARNIRIGATGRVPHLATRAERMEEVRIHPIASISSAFYLRFLVDDAPGVLGRIATALGENGVSIRTVTQAAPKSCATPTPVVVLTHPAQEGFVRAAVAQIDGMQASRASTRVLPVIDT